MRRILALTLAATQLCLSASCYTPPRQIEEGKRPIPTLNTRYGVHWEKVQIGSGPIGYIQHDVRKGVLENKREVITYWVSNQRFHRIGFFTELGYTYRFRHDGTLEFLGVCGPVDAIKVLLDAEGELRYLPMDPPLPG